MSGDSGGAGGLHEVREVGAAGCPSMPLIRTSWTAPSVDEPPGHQLNVFGPYPLNRVQRDVQSPLTIKTKSNCAKR